MVFQADAQKIIEIQVQQNPKSLAGGRQENERDQPPNLALQNQRPVKIQQLGRAAGQGQIIQDEHPQHPQAQILHQLRNVMPPHAALDLIEPIQRPSTPFSESSPLTGPGRAAKPCRWFPPCGKSPDRWDACRRPCNPPSRPRRREKSRPRNKRCGRPAAAPSRSFP